VNVARALERAARHFPDKPAILFEGRRLSYEFVDELPKSASGKILKRILRHSERPSR
jgi:acyl-CoA synthetase (AMP-forming)/AMP-acid ligase II